ncbi:hypothetical protein K501DRAFT_213533, partial [Backusella circina FSU 941]
MQKRCCPDSRLSTLMLPKITPDDEEPDLVLPALDKNAPEVVASMPSHTAFDQLWTRESHINLSTVRAKYRSERKKIRSKIQEKNFYGYLDHYFSYTSYFSRLKSILMAKMTIILFVYSDFLVDLLFCLAYLVEMKQESDVNLEPPWLYKW